MCRWSVELAVPGPCIIKLCIRIRWPVDSPHSVEWTASTAWKYWPFTVNDLASFLTDGGHKRGEHSLTYTTFTDVSADQLKMMKLLVVYSWYRNAGLASPLCQYSSGREDLFTITQAWCAWIKQWMMESHISGHDCTSNKVGSIWCVVTLAALAFCGAWPDPFMYSLRVDESVHYIVLWQGIICSIGLYIVAALILCVFALQQHSGIYFLMHDINIFLWNLTHKALKNNCTRHRISLCVALTQVCTV